MSLPKEPRQKMINLMYLVLTALLALNVSAEIINAFIIVDSSLNKSNDVVNASTQTIMKSFEDKLKDPSSKDKAAIWMPKAQEVVKLSAEVSSLIDELKNEIKIAADFTPQDSSKFKKDNLDIATFIMVEKGKGDLLKKKIEEYKKKVLAIDPKIGEQISGALPIATDANGELTVPATEAKLEKKTWSTVHFNMTPTVAALTMLSKFQSDVKNTENKLVARFHEEVGAVSVRFDTYSPIIGANSTYLFPGQELEITAGIGAMSKNVLPQVTIGGKNIPLNENGVAVSKFGVSTSGTVPIVIRYKDQDGNDQVAERKITYTVGTPTGAFVSAEKVKALYVGLDNVLAVSGGSVGDEKVSVSMSGGSLSKTGPGQYIAKPSPSATTAIVSVNADGKVSQFSFKVLPIPPPVAMVGDSKGGEMSASSFSKQRYLRAVLENFIFDGVKFQVTSARVSFTGAGFSEAVTKTIDGDDLSQVSDLMNRVRPGSVVIFKNVKAQGPDGVKSLQGSFAFQLTL